MRKKKSAEKKLINELKNQLLIQAERLGTKDRYNPLNLEEMKVEAAKKILTEFYMERANLEYELNILGSPKKEILIKLERLNSYVRKAEGLRERHLAAFSKLLEKGLGDRDKTRKAVSRLQTARIKVSA